MPETGICSIAIPWNQVVRLVIASLERGSFSGRLKDFQAHSNPH